MDRQPLYFIDNRSLHGAGLTGELRGEYEQI